MDVTTEDMAPTVYDDDDDDIFWPGLGAIFVFYIIILAVGGLVSYIKKTWKGSSEDMMVAGRDIGLLVGIFTTTATYVGGGYINGTAEYIATPGYGLAWCQAPVGYSISLFLGGLFYAKVMRTAMYTTILDPFQERYGSVMTAFLYIPALLGDVFWSAAILSALGASLRVVVGLDQTWAIIASGGIAFLYTVFGGLYSVIFTDVIQLLCMFVGLWLVVPFAMTHDAVSSISDTKSDSKSNGTLGWLGSLEWNETIGLWIDSALLVMFGGIPWQVYYQRVLSQRTADRARVLSFVAGFGCFIMAIPAVLIGAVYASTDWDETDYNGPRDDYPLALPLVMRYLTPTAVGVIGLGAVSAAVMSSADSSILSSSSMFARNVYQRLRNTISDWCGWKHASDREVVWVMRVSVLVIGGAAVGIAIVVDSIYGLFFLCSDLIFVILFPQLTCILHLKFANTYGAATGYVLGLFFRLAGGEPLIDFPPFIEYPWYDEPTETQNFPFKTMSMLLCFLGIIVGSWVSQMLFKSHILPARADIFKCFTEQEGNEIITDKEPGEDNLAYQYASTKL